MAVTLKIDLCTIKLPNMKFISFLLAIIGFSLQAIAGGKIIGNVKDEKSGDPIIGAAVIVKGTQLGGVTDVDGNFSIVADAGTYTLEVKYMGYQTKEIDDVKVADNDAVAVNVTITESSKTELKEVVVRSTMKKENINSLYILQRNAPTISDGISADIIKKSPDRSTGEVLKRVSGTTIQDNKFVIIRGLSDRYNTAMVDNAILPSTEPNRKAFSFDIIPANLIDNIIISKTATPDLPGDFAGGVINILTKEIPDKNFNTVSIGTSYNTVSTFKDFKSGYRSSTDILGYDNGSRALPSSMPTTKDVQSGLTAQQNKDAISSLNNNYSIHERSALPGMILQASSGRSYVMNNGNRIGIVAAINYTHTETIEPNVLRQYNDYNYTDNSYKYSTNLGAMLNAGYTAGKHKIVFKALYNNVFDDNFLNREGTNRAIGKYTKYYAYDMLQKSLFKTSLEGSHQVGKGQSKVDWLITYNRVGNNQPDQRKLLLSKPIADAKNDAVPFEAEINGNNKSNNRLFSKLGENIYTAGLNYSLPLNFLNKTTIKAGVFEQFRQRTFDARFIGLVLDELKMDPEEAKAIKSRNVANIFDQELVNKGYYRLDEITMPSDKYDATSNTSAGYLMLDNKFNEKFRLVWGVRAESFNIQLHSYDITNKPLDVTKTWLDVLPSANFTYSLNNKSNLRASYYHTVARPEFRELAPFAYYDYELSALSYGNQKLQRSQIKNADLRYELYPKAGEIFSASVFYKHFTNTLESKVDATNSQLEISAENYPSAQNIGAEVEMRKTLSFIAPNSNIFRNLGFYANLAYIKSSVKYSYTDVTGNMVNIERPLTGQSNYVINTSLSYSAMEGKLNLNLLYNRVGPRIFLVADARGNRFGNVWEQPRNLLDFQVAYSVSKKSEFRLNVKDILSARSFFYYDQNNNKKYDKAVIDDVSGNISGDWILKSYRPGSTFSLTYTYKF